MTPAVPVTVTWREASRDIMVVFMDGVAERFSAITRNAIHDGVLTLYRRSERSAAEYHVASLPLHNVRMWVKGEPS